MIEPILGAAIVVAAALLCIAIYLFVRLRTLTAEFGAAWEELELARDRATQFELELEHAREDAAREAREAHQRVIEVGELADELRARLDDTLATTAAERERQLRQFAAERAELQQAVEAERASGVRQLLELDGAYERIAQSLSQNLGQALSQNLGDTLGRAVSAAIASELNDRLAHDFAARVGQDLADDVGLRLSDHLTTNLSRQIPVAIDRHRDALLGPRLADLELRLITAIADAATASPAQHLEALSPAFAHLHAGIAQLTEALASVEQRTQSELGDRHDALGQHVAGLGHRIGELAARLRSLPDQANHISGGVELLLQQADRLLSRVGDLEAGNRDRSTGAPAARRPEHPQSGPGPHEDSVKGSGPTAAGAATSAHATFVDNSRPSSHEDLHLYHAAESEPSLIPPQGYDAAPATESPDGPDEQPSAESVRPADRQSPKPDSVTSAQPGVPAERPASGKGAASKGPSRGTRSRRRGRR